MVSDVFDDEEDVFAVEAEAVGGVQAGLGGGAAVAIAEPGIGVFVRSLRVSMAPVVG